MEDNNQMDSQENVEQTTAWNNVPLLDLAEDHEIWASLADVGLSRNDVIALQSKHMTTKGKPKSLHVVAIGEDVFIVRELRQGDYKRVNEMYISMEAEYVDALRAESPDANLTQQDMDTIEQYCVCSVGVVWPEDFDPGDEDNNFLAVPGLHYKIMEVSGAFEVPVSKKV